VLNVHFNAKFLAHISGSPVWKPRDDSSVGGDHPTSSTSSTPACGDPIFGGHL